MVTY